MLIARSAALFVVAALFEIGGAWLIWQGVREHRGWLWMAGGVLALGAYGFVATFQRTPTSAASSRPTAASSWRARSCGEWWRTATGPIDGTSPGHSYAWREWR